VTSLLSRIHASGRKTTFGRVATWVGIAVAGTLITLGVRTVVTRTVDLVNPSPPSLEAQLEKILRTSALKGYQLAYSRSIDFRGPDRQSRVLVFRNFSRGDIRGSSDELRIYDLAHGRLQLAFAFQPVARISAGASTTSIPSSVDLLAGGDLTTTDALR
jgi:hypothetical protein